MRVMARDANHPAFAWRGESELMCSHAGLRVTGEIGSSPLLMLGLSLGESSTMAAHPLAPHGLRAGDDFPQPVPENFLLHPSSWDNAK